MSRQLVRTKPLPFYIRLLAPIILGLVIVSVWFFLTATQLVPQSLLPMPSDVATRIIIDLVNGSSIKYAAATLIEALFGCLVAVIIGIPLGFAIASSRIFEAAISPFLAASQAIPSVAIAPLLVIWVGYGTLPIVLLCAIMVIFPVVLGTVFGVRHINKDVLNAALVDGASGLALIRYITWPLSLAAVLTGIRNGFTLSITGAVVGEFVMGGQGLGMLISIQSSMGDTIGLFATLVLLSVLAITIYSLLIVLEWRWSIKVDGRARG